MRVYELAKLLGVTSKEVINRLNEPRGYVGTHMSVLTDDEVNFVENAFNSPKKVDNLNLEKERFADSKKPRPKKQESGDLGQNINLLKIEPMTVLDFCQGSGVPINQVVLDFLKSGRLYGVNQRLSALEVKEAAELYGIQCEEPASKTSYASGPELKTKSGESRLPVVVVVGHVDHGKTTLLDFIRKTSVAQKEKGGITQHLGAYKVTTGHGDLVFLDTPGHEAFSLMRSRGVRVADLVVLVIAADDGVKPQTIEAISCAQEMKVPIVVAINKVDRVEPSRIEAVKTQLSQHGVVGEDWGGDAVMVPISAKSGQGVDSLLEMLALQSEVMDLKADAKAPAVGYVLEAHVEKGRGKVATFIAQNGTLRSGDYFICGDIAGRVSLLIDSSGKVVKSVGPSEPVKVTGLSDLPKAGSVLRVVDQSEYKKFVKGITTSAAPTYADTNAINIIIKADNDSSREAIVNEVNKKFADSGVRVVSSSIGNVTSADVDLASSCKCLVYTFGVKFDSGAENLARQLKVDIRRFYIIYHLLDDIEKLVESKKEVATVRKRVGSARVKKVFKTKTMGCIAGVQITDGKVVKGAEVEIFRANDKVGSGTIKSLQRDKKTMKEVLSGFEGAFVVDGFDDWEEGDVVDCFLEVKEGAA